MPITLSEKKDLFQVFLSIKGDKLMEEFLVDLLTLSEFEEIIKRWQVVKALYRGISQRQIAADLGVSIATVTRGSRELRNKKGGFRKILEK